MYYDIDQEILLTIYMYVFVYICMHIHMCPSSNAVTLCMYVHMFWSQVQRLTVGSLESIRSSGTDFTPQLEISEKSLLK